MIEARQFLRALRGKRSQQAFSRRMGYRSNVAAQWEAGRRMPTARVALELAARSGVDVQAALHQFHPASAKLLHTLDDPSLSTWLKSQVGSRSIGELVRGSTLSRYQISRALSGSSKPKLTEFFELVDALTGRLPEFIGCFVDIRLVPSAHAAHQRVMETRHLVAREPWCAALLTLFDTDAYRQSSLDALSFLEQRLPLERTRLEHCLQLLQESRALAWHKGKFVLRPMTVDLAGESALQLRAHWARVSTERLVAPGERDLFSYNLVSVSEQDYERIRELQREFFRKIRGIVAASRPSETAALLTWHLIKWAPPTSSDLTQR